MNLLEMQIIWQLDVFAPFEKQRNMFGIRIPLFFKKNCRIIEPIICYLHLRSLIRLCPQVQIPSNFWQKQSPGSQCACPVPPMNNSEKETKYN